MREKRTLQNAHMPTWIKATIMGLRAGATRGSYRDLGRKIGANIESYHDEGIDPIDERFSDDEWNSIFTWDG